MVWAEQDKQEQYSVNEKFFLVFHLISTLKTLIKMGRVHKVNREQENI